jgi:hypothetical protein
MKWAVMRKGRKRAVRVFDSEQEALWYCEYTGISEGHSELGQDYSLRDGWEIVERPGKEDL